MRTLINVLSVNIFLKLYNLINVSRLYVDKLFFLIKKQNAELFLFPKCFFVAPLSYRERVFFELAKKHWRGCWISLPMCYEQGRDVARTTTRGKFNNYARKIQAISKRSFACKSFKERSYVIPKRGIFQSVKNYQPNEDFFCFCILTFK